MDVLELAVERAGDGTVGDGPHAQKADVRRGEGDAELLLGLAEPVQDALSRGQVAEEELGVPFAPGEVRPLGVRAVADRPAPGTLNREFQHVYLARSRRSLDAWTRLDRREVSGLVALELPAFTALVHRGEPQPGRSWDGERVTRALVAPGELVPSPYLAVLAVMLERYAAGLEPLAL